MLRIEIDVKSLSKVEEKDIFHHRTVAMYVI